MHRLRRLWRRILIRRSQRSRATWDRLNPILNRWIPVPRVLHPYPTDRFIATHPRREPYAWTRTYGSVRGATSDGRPYRNTNPDYWTEASALARSYPPLLSRSDPPSL